MNKAASSILVLVAFVSACGPNQRILNSAVEPSANTANVPTANVQPTAGSLERDLNAMRTADFKFIYVFRRKDGAAFDSDDKKFMNAYTPSEINRRRLSDEGKAIIAGSNYDFPPESRKVLTERFIVEDHSTLEGEIDKQKTANINSNE